MKDLTVIYITANEVPAGWEAYHRKVLLEAIVDYPLITVSRKPMNLGTNLLDEDKKSYTNIYRQLLRACKIATTDYVAVAEDDVLYHKHHFDFFRPKADEVAYNMNKWSLYTWEPTLYSNKMRKTNAALIAPRLYLIDALEERFSHAKNGELLSPGEIGRENVDRWNHCKPRNAVEVYSTVAIIQVSHPAGTEERQKIMRKSFGKIRATSIPYWGEAKEIAKKYG